MTSVGEGCIDSVGDINANNFGAGEGDMATFATTAIKNDFAREKVFNRLYPIKKLIS